MLTRNQIQRIETSNLTDALKEITVLFPSGVRFSSSLGMEDQVITDAICSNALDIEIFTLDTGRLFYETYELIERTNARYHTRLKIYFPDYSTVEELVTEKGINCFYESVENRKQCCFIRKVEPLNRALKNATVWITGVRAEQSANRKQIPMMEWDEQRNLYKFNPLINWTYDEVIHYIRQREVPYNPLHDMGYVSIGCAPCTRAISPGEDARAGRWWWETSQKECGLHRIHKTDYRQ
ncbi:MAG: phosphoadenylyl-sulfate reductase [Bacteroidetes bacterium]|nr:phosphoadenylyl-sulfate reductase [Bacteroidota bacterium]MBS1633695.1 phosphoadenylyl-sulfate reductase [Bacteroidota bacterium]